MDKRTYRFGQSSLTLQFGDITTSDADALVSSDDYMLSMGGGVSAAIRKAGGLAIVHDASKKIPAKRGDVVVTTAGALAAKYVFHAITIGPNGGDLTPHAVIEKATRRCLELVDMLGLESIAFPAIGAGAARFSYGDVAVQMARVIAANLESRERPIQVTIYLFGRFRQSSGIDFVSFFEEFAKRVPELPEHTTRVAEDTGDADEEERSLSKSEPPDQQDAEAAQRKALIRHLGSLGQERDLLERRLVELEGGLSDKEIAEIEDRLAQIHRSRLETLGKLHQPAQEGTTVFISYAHEDEGFRVALGKHLRALEHQRLVTTWHDRKITAGASWRDEIDENLESAGIILLLISADFMNSDYCYGVEMKRALERHEKGAGLVIPVILRPVMWANAPFANLQALPTDGRPVSTWSDSDLAFVDITEGVKSAIEEMPRADT